MSIGGLLVGAFLQQCNGCWVLESHHMFLRKKKWCNLVWKYLGVALKESNSIFISVTRRSRSDVGHSLPQSFTHWSYGNGLCTPLKLIKGKNHFGFLQSNPKYVGPERVTPFSLSLNILVKHHAHHTECLFKLDSMNLDESEWVSKSVNESQWVSKSVNESQWVSMSLNESQWIWKSVNECQWGSMSLNEWQWGSMSLMGASASRCDSRGLSVATQSAQDLPNICTVLINIYQILPKFGQCFQISAQYWCLLFSWYAEQTYKNTTPSCKGWFAICTIYDAKVEHPWF